MTVQCAKCAFETPSFAELVSHAAEYHPEITRAASRARCQIKDLKARAPEGTEPLMADEHGECPNCANPPHAGPCRRKAEGTEGKDKDDQTTGN